MRTRVLMVCLGNICRSPLAEGILKSKVNSAYVDVDSAGTAGYHIGNHPDRRSIAVAEKYGIDIRDQRCRIFTKQDFVDFDMIFAMDRSNLSDILALADVPEHIEKVSLLLEEADLDYQEVPDPYYGGEQGFELVFDLVSKACDEIAQRIHQG